MSCPLHVRNPRSARNVLGTVEPPPTTRPPAHPRRVHRRPIPRSPTRRPPAHRYRTRRPLIPHLSTRRPPKRRPRTHRPPLRRPTTSPGTHTLLDQPRRDRV